MLFVKVSMTQWVPSCPSQKKSVFRDLEVLNTLCAWYSLCILKLDSANDWLLLFFIVFFNNIFRVSWSYIFALKPLEHFRFNGLSLLLKKGPAETSKTCLEPIVVGKASNIFLKINLWSLGRNRTFALITEAVNFMNTELFDSKSFVHHENWHKNNIKIIFVPNKKIIQIFLTNSKKWTTLYW